MVWSEGEQGWINSLNPMQRLVAASAGSAVAATQMLFALDRRLADCWRLTNEPMIGQIRLAWWRDALSADEESPEPLVAGLQGLPQFAGLQPHLAAMVDGWEEWIVREDETGRESLLAFAQGRGGGLFRAMGELAGLPAEPGVQEESALVWALWDMAGQLRDSVPRGAMLALAGEMAGNAYASSMRLPKPAAMLARLARADVLAGRVAPADMTPAFYLRVIMAQFLAR